MLWWLAQNALVAAGLAAAVAVAGRPMRLGPAARHALWVVVLVKLVTPPLLVWPWPVACSLHWPAGTQTVVRPATTPREAGPTGVVVETPPPAVPSTPAPRQGTPPRAPASVAHAGPTASAPQSAVGPVAAPGVSWSAVLAWFWATGSLLMILLEWKRIRNMQALVAASGEPPAGLARDVAAWAEKLRVRAPRVRLVSGTSSPMIWGLGRPLLLWPAALEGEGDPGRWQGVLVHELAHLRRRDHWVGWLELVAGCLWWPNPLFWYVRHQVRENAELACDAWVVGTLPEGRRAYAEALLNVCEFARQTAPLPAVGVGSGTRRAFERRLTMILKDRVAFRLSRWSLAAVAVLAVLTLPNWTQSQDSGKVGPAPGNTFNMPTSSDPFQNRDNPFGQSDRGSRNETPAYPSSQGPAPAKGGFQRTYGGNDAPSGTRSAQPPVGDPAFGEEGAYPGVASANEISSLTPQQLRALEQQLSQMLRAVEALHEHRTIADEPLEEAGHVVATTTFTLTKTTYSLPDDKGQALQDFLAAHVGEPAVLRITRDGDDQLTVVASPEAQRTIGDLILLMKKSPAKPPAAAPADFRDDGSENFATPVEEDFATPVESGKQPVDELPPGSPIPRR